MKKVLTALLSVFLISTAFTIGTSNFCRGKKIKVSGMVMHTPSFCGGMRMADDQMKEFTKPRALPSKKLFVIKGKENDLSQKTVLEFTSDSAGNFSISLPAGDYCIVDESKRNKIYIDKFLADHEKETQNYSAVDTTCFAGWLKTPDALLHVTSAGLKNFVIIYNDRCPWYLPCVNYRGPLPP